MARAFSPRVARCDPAVVLDVSGLRRIVGDPPAIGRELAREARERGIEAAVAIATSRTAATLSAWALVPGTSCERVPGDWRVPGAEPVMVIPPGEERQAVGEISIAVLEELAARRTQKVLRRRQKDLCALCVLCGESLRALRGLCGEGSPCSQLPILRGWGLRTLGELAALAPADLGARLGAAGLALHRVACGSDDRPLVPHVDAARFEASLDLEWPIETLEPLSFVLARLLEPLSTALERADRGAAAIALALTLVTRERHEIRLELPAPMRDARTLRTLLTLALEARPVPAGIDRVAIAVDPTPGRIVQHSLLQRALPSPECLSTLVARLEALMGAGRVGVPRLVDSHEPGAFELRTVDCGLWIDGGNPQSNRQSNPQSNPQSTFHNPQFEFVLRRFRLPVPARVDMQNGRPVRVTTARRGLAGGRVEQCAGPWRSSGGWWQAVGTGLHATHGFKQGITTSAPSVSEAWQALGVGPQRKWNKDEWDVATPDGLYRIYKDRVVDRWFIEGILD